MQPSGRAQVEAARADGRWDRAYESPANAQVPDDFLRALRRHKGALAFFRSLNRANVFAICLSAADREAARDPPAAARRGWCR